ncbi:T9SS type A sorting domain-containing protein [bacterium]|nr:T9SS type A sorting domain-containing protein [bacterium]RQV95839.1 MAG: T9SS C-terminal target domain-containing protein [bacterium]
MMNVLKKAFFIFSVIFLFGLHFIFAQSEPDSFSKEGIAQISKVMINDLRINEDIGPDDQESPAVAMNKYGYAVACWGDLRSGNSRIYFQLFGDNGFAVKNNIEVYPMSGTMQQLDPDVAMNDLGHFVVVYDDERDGDFDIYGQMYTANAIPKGCCFKVNDDIASRTQLYPAIAMNGEGHFVVCWSEGDTAIYAQRYASDGTALGSNFKVNNSVPWSRSRPDICMNEDGSFIIVWQDYRNACVSYIYARRFDNDGVALGDDFQVNLDLIGEKHHIMPSIALQKDGKFMICYMIEGLVYALYAHLYDSDGSSLVDYFEIPEWGVSSNNVMPSVCAHPNGGLSVAWSSDKNGTFDIWTRNYNDAGAPLGPSSRVSDVSGDQTFPSLAIDDRGIAVAVWEDTRNTDKDIYGFGLGPLAPLNPTAGTGFPGIVPLSWDHLYAYSDIDVYNIYRSTISGGPYDPLVTVDLSLRGVLGRQMRDYIDTDVANGTTYYYKISAVVSGYESQRSVEVSATPSAEGYEIMSGWSGTPPTIDGLITPGEWAGATSINIANPYAPSAITLYVKNDADNLYIAIDDSNDINNDPGNLLGIIFDENNDDMWDTGGPSGEGLITINNAASLFTGYWGTYPNSLGADVPIAPAGITKYISNGSGHVQYEASFDLATSPINASPGETIGIAFMLDDPTNFYAYHYGYAAEWPVGALWEAAMPLGELTLATTDGITGDKNRNGLPSSYFLSQNYPNPFNPETVISYTLPEKSHVNLVVYNIAGEKVRTLVDMAEDTGYYSVRWDGKDDSGNPLSAGLYLYRIHCGSYQNTTRMILLK